MDLSTVELGNLVQSIRTIELGIYVYINLAGRKKRILRTYPDRDTTDFTPGGGGYVPTNTNKNIFRAK